MSTLSWVIGRGGLLGSAVERRLGSPLWSPESPICWNDSVRLQPSIEEAVCGFRARLATENFDTWCVYWCAGSGVVGTPADRLNTETASLKFFLDCLGTALEKAHPVAGQVFLAGSAGGVYAGSMDHPLTEQTLPLPISDYGRAKLEQEDVLRRWARSKPNVSTLVGRLSNLYGPGQRLDKPQGLISHISRCLIYSIPVRIYVSLDTIRDYLFADDAAASIVAGMARLGWDALRGEQHVIKVYSSGNEITIAGLIGLFRQIAKRHLRVISGIVPARYLQPPRLQFRSTVWLDQSDHPRTELLDGVNRVHRHQLALFQKGLLRPPPA